MLVCTLCMAICMPLITALTMRAQRVATPFGRDLCNHTHVSCSWSQLTGRGRAAVTSSWQFAAFLLLRRLLRPPPGLLIPASPRGPACG